MLTTTSVKWDIKYIEGTDEDEQEGVLVSITFPDRSVLQFWLNQLAGHAGKPLRESAFTASGASFLPPGVAKFSGERRSPFDRKTAL